MAVKVGIPGEPERNARVGEVFVYDNFVRTNVNEVEAGDICAFSGIPDIKIGETVMTAGSVPLPTIQVRRGLRACGLYARLANTANEVRLPCLAANSPSVAANSPSVAANSPSVAANSPSVAVNSPSVAVNSPSVAVNSCWFYLSWPKTSKRRGYNPNTRDGRETGTLPRHEFNATEGEFPATEGELTATEGEFTATEGEFTATEGELTATEGELTATEGEFAATEGDEP
eukprot:1183663-Prorocentrum_minimum.AAC.1